MVSGLLATSSHRRSTASSTTIRHLHKNLALNSEKMANSDSEKTADAITPAHASESVEAIKLENREEQFEVFKRGDGAVDFRTVGWIHASVIFLKGGFPRRIPSSALC